MQFSTATVRVLVDIRVQLIQKVYVKLHILQPIRKVVVLVMILQKNKEQDKHLL